MEEMTKLGDIASSQGKSFDQLTEAVLDAGTGEFERLKEFGIQASKSGDEVELSFKGVQQTVANTPDAIQGALLAFGELEGVQGSMAAISQTLEGRVSNLGDNFDALKLTIGEGLKPVFALIIEAMSYGIEIVKDLFEWFGKLGENSTFLGGVWEAITDIAKTIWNTFKSIFETTLLIFSLNNFL
jgi:phage-related protein